MTDAPDTAPAMPDAAALLTMQDSVREFVEAHPRLFVLTGAGCSTESGIADYRDREGAWKRPMPITYQAFTQDPAVRQRYWARAMIGWRHIRSATPNAAHRTLARWEQEARMALLLTQNVDGLHAAAGSTALVDLHGTLDRVVCLRCGTLVPRDEFQTALAERNPAFAALYAPDAPDGDADLDETVADFSAFDVPHHEACGGLWKPDVVFYGESVPSGRVKAAMAALENADAMLVIGSSLMVYSGYRFALAAAKHALPIAALNIGQTRADALLSLKIPGPAAAVLAGV